MTFSAESLAGNAQITSSGGSGGLFSPFSINILPEQGQIPNPDWGIVGLRLSLLWGRNKNMLGLDLAGLGNVTQETFVGSALAGGFNATGKQAAVLGFQVAGLANVNHGKATVIGLQLAGLTNINEGESTVIGVQAGLTNFSSATDIYGLQVGAYNRARKVVGLQIGIINVAQTLKGFQLGLININNASRPFKMFPVFNIGF